MPVVSSNSIPPSKVAELYEVYLKSQTDLVSFPGMLQMYYPSVSPKEITRLAEGARRESDNNGRLMPNKLPPGTVKRIKQLFGSWDADKSGGIDLGEFSEALKNLPIDHELVQGMFAAHDADGNGVLDVDEFVCLMDQCNLFPYFDKICEHQDQNLRDSQRRGLKLADIFTEASPKKGIAGAARRGRRPSLSHYMDDTAMSEALLGA